MEIFKTKILRLLKHKDYKPVKLSKLEKTLGLTSEEHPQFKKAFDELRQSSQLVIGAGNLVGLPPMAGRIIGTFRANPKGFGFVIPRDLSAEGDLYIPAKETANAVTGDVVAAKVIRKGRRGPEMRLSGKIVEILQRSQNKFVGILVKKPDGWIVNPEGKGFLEPVAVDDVTAKGAREKDKVVFEILTWPTEKYLARGVIVEVLGKAGRYETEINAIIRQYRLPGDFDESCIEQAREAAAEFIPESSTHREDITDKVVITIDPPDAKDFDDAISLEKDSQGHWVLGVHIADVSSFIRPDSPLDAEAKLRGNSVYLPGKTIPMLPEILSNGICSLQPNQKRFTKSAYITYDNEANIVSRRFANSVICSTQRLTYKQADSILKRHTTDDCDPKVIELLGNMEKLSRLIGKRRIDNGMLHLALPETELIMDKAGLVIDAEPADDCYPHTIIEMFMVEANEAVAGLFDKLNISLMRRVHPDPDPLSLRNLSRQVNTFGLSVPRKPVRADIQALLDSVKGEDCSLAVNLIVLRSFEKAVYSPLRIGHFALASTNYCHFTSPIRRYADLLVHRVLECYLNGSLESSPENYVLMEHELAEIAKHITFTDQQAESADYELKNILILQMLSSRVGQELDCVVTGINSYGVFVQCRKFGIEGLIRTEVLGPDKWKFNQKTQSLTGLNSGVTIHLGRLMKVRIISVNVPARQLDLAPVEPLVGGKRISGTKKTKKKRCYSGKRKVTQRRK
ncbi:MAG: ribonuclease R [Planctomycetota bacterium]